MHPLAEGCERERHSYGEVKSHHPFQRGEILLDLIEAIVIGCDRLSGFSGLLLARAGFPQGIVDFRDPGICLYGMSGSMLL